MTKLLISLEESDLLTKSVCTAIENKTKKKTKNIYWNITKAP